MTGRRLYEIYCDGRKEHFYPRYEGGATTFATTENGEDRFPVAWPYLKRSEQKVWNHVALRMKGVRRA